MALARRGAWTGRSGYAASRSWGVVRWLQAHYGRMVRHLALQRDPRERVNMYNPTVASPRWGLTMVPTIIPRRGYIIV